VTGRPRPAYPAARAGVAFYAGNDKVWLADRIAPEFMNEIE